ncbi:hypothetical protein OUZ56_007489 [Daphnia magna]|uniref:Uncharacterized protein n=1 Tax=Daphnia magna TaxID=35525 RepID=A0ABR0AA39_9CRUS|nr:hypothetical protein OUZ56_007489 [Daphnia magna]
MYAAYSAQENASLGGGEERTQGNLFFFVCWDVKGSRVAPGGLLSTAARAEEPTTVVDILCGEKLRRMGLTTTHFLPFQAAPLYAFSISFVSAFDANQFSFWPSGLIAKRDGLN